MNETILTMGAIFIFGYFFGFTLERIVK